MLQTQGKGEEDIARSLDRLKQVIKDRSAVPSIPAFYYSASLLNEYAKINGPDNVRSDFFSDFKTLILDFGNRDFSKIKKNHQAIIDSILQIVDSQLFINCLRPDIRSSKGEYMRKEYEDILKEQNEMVMSKQSNYQYKNSLKKRTSKADPQSPTKSVFISQYDQLWETVERHYREHNLDQAFKKATEYVEKINKKVDIPSNRQELINSITQEYMTMVSLYDEFDKPGWEMDKEQNGITLQYKVYEEEKQIAIRIQGEFPIPAIEFLAIIAQIDLMGQYVPFCYDCKELKVLSRNQRIGTSKVYIPLLSDRQTYFYAVGYDRIKQTGSLFLYSKTINEDVQSQKKYDFKVPQPNQKYVRLQYKFFIVEYVPVSKTRAKIRLASKIDMKMNYLPLFILNKSARIFAFDYFKNILEKVKDYKGSAWQKKVKERPQMYDFFFERINEEMNNK